MRAQGDDEPARRCGGPCRRRRRADRDRRQRPLRRALPPPFLRAAARRRSAPAEPRHLAQRDAPRLDHPRQAGRPRLDPGGRARSSASCARRASRRPRSATAARSTRWRAACCRSRSARRPSSPAGCSTRPRPMTSPSASARRPTRSTPKGEVVATSDVRPTLERGRSRPAALHRRDRAGPARLFGAEDRRQGGLRPRPRRRGGRD